MTEKYLIKKRWRNKKLKEFYDYKKTLCCEVCGEDHYRCLEFHHIDPSTKKAHISNLAKCASTETLMEEIKKCRVLCANCHRKEHDDIGNLGIHIHRTPPAKTNQLNLFENI
jgi:hypothetical protein